MDLSMQMKALRSLNFAKLSSSRSTRDEYWVTSISAGTPAGYRFSQMRSMLFPSWFVASEFGPFAGTGHVISLSIEHSGGRWQAAARLEGMTHGNVPVRPTGTATSAASDPVRRRHP